MTKQERAERLEAGEDSVVQHVAIAVDRSEEKVKEKKTRRLNVSLFEMGSTEIGCVELES